MRRFDGRTAFVTGGGHGIGRACARRLAAEGASVVLADVDVDAARSVSNELADAGAPVLDVECDVTDVSSVASAVRAAVARFGGLDTLVNTAGGDRAGADPDDEDWAAVLELNLLGVVRCVRAALPHLLGAARGASVVTIGSVNGLVNLGSDPYSAAKAALVSLNRNLAATHAAAGVRFNLIAPATIRTRVWDDQAEDLARLTSQYPLGRVGTPEDVAAAVAFLASDDAAWLTGVTLPLDGGLLAAGPMR